MRIPLTAISPQCKAKVNGDEPWLDSIYQSFPLPNGESEQAVVSAHFSLTLEEAGSVLVEGELRFQPRVSCSRCDKALTWQVNEKVCVRFLPALHNDAPKEKNLSRDELDVYFIEDDTVDLEQLINDTIQTALPTQYLPLASDGKTCTICNVDVSGERVYGRGNESQQASPFSVLKGLKLPN